MGRRAAVTPGTDPQPDTPEGDAPEVGAAPVDFADADLREIVRKQAADMADMRATIKALARNQVATAPAEKVKLPAMAEVLKANPKVPVLSEEGWFVPPVHPTDRIAKV